MVQVDEEELPVQCEGEQNERPVPEEVATGMGEEFFLNNDHVSETDPEWRSMKDSRWAYLGIYSLPILVAVIFDLHPPSLA